jgi:hypothetical protein
VSLVPRVRVRVRPRCDDDCECPAPPQESWTRHPIVVALATVGAQVAGEWLVSKLKGSAATAVVVDDDDDELEDEAEEEGAS